MIPRLQLLEGVTTAPLLVESIDGHRPPGQELFLRYNPCNYPRYNLYYVGTSALQALPQTRPRHDGTLDLDLRDPIIG
jgi:hypothetical protein